MTLTLEQLLRDPMLGCPMTTVTIELTDEEMEHFLIVASRIDAKLEESTHRLDLGRLSYNQITLKVK